jgi:predicted Zn-dependent peptidase
MIKRYLIAAVCILIFARAYAEPTGKILKNGMRVVLNENRATNLIGVSILVSGGTHFEKEEEKGTFRLLELMLTRGTEKRTESAIAEQISLLGDSLSISTTEEYWSCEATVPADKLKDLLDLARDLLFNPTFPENELSKVKKIAVQSIKASEDSPWNRMSELYQAVFYPDFHAEKETKIANIQNTNRTMILRIHNEYFTPGNMIISIAGNIDPERTTELIKTIFGSLPNRVVPRRVELNQQDTPLPLFRTGSGGITQAGILLGTRLTGFDRRDEHILMVLDAVLDNSLGGRLYEEVRENRGLVYSISPHYSLGIEPYTWFVFSTSRKKNIKPVISETEEVLKGLKRKPVTDVELGLAKEYLKTELAVSYLSPLTGANYNALALLRGEEPKSLSERIGETEAVSREELNTFIDTYFPKQWTKLIIR